MDRLQLRIFQVDTYLLKPYHVNKILHGKRCYQQNAKWKNVQNVTVFRLFGTTVEGIKTCLHVHRYFSHLSVRKKDLLEIYKIKAMEDETLIEIFKDDFSDQYKSRSRGEHGQDEAIIESIKPYSGRSMYGFHEHEETFYKVSFFSHFVCSKAKAFLESGQLSNQTVLTYNCLEQMLQFYVDNQIFLNTIEFSNVTFRRTFPFREEYPSQENDELFKMITTHKMRSLPFYPIFNEHEPTSSCFIEADATIDQIVHSSHDKLFPDCSAFSPRSPGIINMWNEQFERNNVERRYDEIIKILSSHIERDSIWSDFNLHTGTLSSFLKKRNDNSQPKESSNNNEQDDQDKIPQLDGNDDLQDNVVTVKQAKTYRIQDASIGLQKISPQFLLKAQFVNISPKLRAKLQAYESSCQQQQQQAKEHTVERRDSIYSFYDVDSPQSSGNISQLSHFSAISPMLNNELKKFKTLHSTPILASEAPRRKLLSQFNESLNYLHQERSLNTHGPPASTRRRFSFLASQSQSRIVNCPANLFGLSMFDDNSFERSGSLLLNETQSNAELVWHKCAALTTMSLEVLVNTRDHLVPDPQQDSVEVVAFAIYNEYLKDEFIVENRQQFHYLGLIVVEPRHSNTSKVINFTDNKAVHVNYVADEQALFDRLSYLVVNFDPDILLGWTVDTLSWGYLLQRAKFRGWDFMLSISRINNSYFARDNFEGEKDKSPRLVGRIVLNVWYTLRHELTLKSYTFESVHHHLFQVRVPKYSHQYLRTLWAKSRAGNELCGQFVLDYLVGRATGVIKILCHLDFIRRTFDLSCLFGMKFEDVLGRGTQFRVESMLFPIARADDFLPLRFPNTMVTRMAAPEHIPLNIEPAVSLYKEPVAVLDFQSLYPSIMIAHNYCFTTCLGRVRNIIRSDKTLGCYHFDEQRDVYLGKLKPEDVFVSPNGVAFVKEHVRKSLLSKLLEDLLFTRMLIKTEMKRTSKEMAAAAEGNKSKKAKLVLKTLQRKLDTCQLGLKLIANVTYGYTSANYTGRMPCVEVADSIVAKGRDMLERSIEMVNTWGQESGTGARVIYGDTDSMFISFPNSTRQEAFEHSKVLVNEINRRHRHPISIKLEKVYQPCILFAKKRYCGYAYESADQVTPAFDAKGIETVRRDTCDIAAKILEQSLRLLFENDGQVSSLKSFVQWHLGKILNGKISRLNDFIFAKEFSGFNAYQDGWTIPSWRVARRRLDKDPGDEAKYNERIPYVIIEGDAGDNGNKGRGNKNQPRLADLARDPLELLLDSKLCINSAYYIERVIYPPLERVLLAVTGATAVGRRGGGGCGGVLHLWLDEAKASANKRPNKLILGRRMKLMAWFKQTICPLCHTNTIPVGVALCRQCSDSSFTTIVALSEQLAKVGHKMTNISDQCGKCSGGLSVAQLQSFNQAGGGGCGSGHVCISIDCDNIYRYYQSIENFAAIHRLYQQISPSLGNQH